MVELRAYLDLAEDEGNAWGRLAEALTALGRVDEAADAYLTEPVDPGELLATITAVLRYTRARQAVQRLADNPEQVGRVAGFGEHVRYIAALREPIRLLKVHIAAVREHGLVQRRVGTAVGHGVAQF